MSMSYKKGQIVINVLPNGQEITCRIVEFIDSVQMFRVTDARETESDEVLIRKNKTWAVPLENLKISDAHDELDYGTVMEIAQVITQNFTIEQVSAFLSGNKKGSVYQTLEAAVLEAKEFYEINQQDY